MSVHSVAEVAPGQELPALEIPITPALVIGGAIVSRDFQDVHHDRDAARARGARDVFMNILTTNGLVGRYVTDWAGPAAVLRKVSIRLGIPNYPGDVMRLSGRVTEADPATGRVRVEMTGANAGGNHVTGTIELDLPVEAP